MAFIPTKAASNAAKQIAKEPNIVLVIEDIPFKFGSQSTDIRWRFDQGFLLDDGLFFDSVVQDPNSKDYISIEGGGTSKTISQQVSPDKGGRSSSLTMSIEIVDINGEVTDIFKAGNYVQDILGQKASIYIGFKGTDFESDYVPVLHGYIDSIMPKHGSYVVNISHAENKKRQEIFNVYTSVLTASIDDLVTTIPVETTKDLIEPVDTMTTYIRIEDEIMQVLSFTDTTIEVNRSVLGTLSTSHDDEAELSSIYGFQDDAITLALKLYLSGGDEFYSENVPTTTIGEVNGSAISNSIFFNDVYLEKDLGITTGDIISITDSANGNDGTYTILNIVNVENGSYLIADNTLNVETTLGPLVNFKSKYNVYGEGLGLTPFEVDVPTHEEEYNQNSSSLPIYQFYISEEINGKDFIDTQVYFPSGLYSISRNAQISCKFTRPPLSVETLPVINETNIIKPQSITSSRSTHRYFYNSVVYKYEKSPRDEEYKFGNIALNEDSRNRVQKEISQLTIESDGLRRSGDTTSLINRQTGRFFQRYQYGAREFKNVQVLFEVGWNLEVGDVLTFGSPNLQIPDLDAGTRYTDARLVEVVNKSMDFTTGMIKLHLIESGYDIQGRYGVFSPSSFITNQSTTTKLVLTKSFDTGVFFAEREKWQEYVGERIRVRAEDYSFDEVTTISGLDPANQEALFIDPPLSSVAANYLVECPTYSPDPLVDRAYKLRYTYNAAQVEVTSVTSDSVFEVDDVTNLIVGGTIIIRDEDYTEVSSRREIQDITANTVTLTEDSDITVTVGKKVDNYTFPDGGDAYLHL